MQHDSDEQPPSPLFDDVAGPEPEAPQAAPSPEVLAWQEDQLHRSERLVDALTDQYAAGQVEALYGLHTASAAVRRETAQVTALLEQLTQLRHELDQTFERVTTSVASTLSTRLAAQVDRSLQELLVERLQPFAQALMEAANGARETIAAASHDSVEMLRSVAGDLESRLGAAGETAAATSQQSAEFLQTLVSDLEALLSRTGGAAAAQLEASAGAIDRAGTTVERRLAHAVSDAAAGLERAGELVTAVSAETIDSVEHVSRGVAATLATMTDEFLAELGGMLTAQRQREVKAETDREARVQKLVLSTDASLEHALERLRRETDRLASRDERQEQLRADAFVAALETLLDQSSGKLRSRVREVIGLERRRRDATGSETRVAAPPTASAATPAASRTATAAALPEAKAKAVPRPKPKPAARPRTTAAPPGTAAAAARQPAKRAAATSATKAATKAASPARPRASTTKKEQS